MEGGIITHNIEDHHLFYYKPPILTYPTVQYISWYKLYVQIKYIMLHHDITKLLQYQNTTHK